MGDAAGAQGIEKVLFGIESFHIHPLKNIRHT
jgi:hypothetical protein